MHGCSPLGLRVPGYMNADQLPKRAISGKRVEVNLGLSARWGSADVLRGLQTDVISFAYRHPRGNHSWDRCPLREVK